MTNTNTTELLREVTQSLLAIMVVAGAGYALVFHPTGSNEAITGALGMVLGWYFHLVATSAATSAANARASGGNNP